MYGVGVVGSVALAGLAGVGVGVGDPLSLSLDWTEGRGPLLPNIPVLAFLPFSACLTLPVSLSLRALLPSSAWSVYSRDSAVRCGGAHRSSLALSLSLSLSLLQRTQGFNTSRALFFLRKILAGAPRC